MVVCRFFLQGNCKFGENCKNEHPRNQNSQQNRFAPLQNQGGLGGRGRSGAFGGGSDNNKQAPYSLDVGAIKDDLTNGADRPEWPLSSYAPGNQPPRQLIEGPLELSPEEMRVQCYLARASGKGEEYANQEKALLQQSQQQTQTILNDLEAAKRYVLDGENSHPNRLDMVVKPNQDFPWVKKPGPSQTGQLGAPMFGGGANNVATGPSPSGFGAPSSLGAPKAGGFGAPSTMGQGSTFGSSSALGGGSGFGKPAQLGGGSGFGQASQLGGGSGFGQASQLGGASGFGAPSKLGGGSTFGQSSNLGTSSPFGGAAKPAAFGQASQPTNALGQSAQPAFGQSGFGSGSKPSPFSGASQPSGFGQPSQTTSPFGQQPLAQQSTFAQPIGSTFGQGSALGSKPSPFAAAAQPQQQSSTTSGSPFGQSSALGAKPSPFAAAAQTQQPQGQLGSSASTGGSTFGQATTFGAKPSPFAPAAQAQQQQPASSSPFGAPTAPSAFGKPSPFAAQGQGQNITSPFAKPGSTFGGGFGNASSGTAFGAASTGSTGGFGSATQAGAGAAPQNRSLPSTWNNQPVIQEKGAAHIQITENNTTKLKRIWFPTGPPEATQIAIEAAEAEDKANYEGQLGETLKSLYQFAMTEGAFKDNIMPEIPPKREWVSFDF